MFVFCLMFSCGPMVKELQLIMILRFASICWSYSCEVLTVVSNFSSRCFEIAFEFCSFIIHSRNL